MCPEQKKLMPLSDWTVGPRGRSAVDLTSDPPPVMIKLAQARGKALWGQVGKNSRGLLSGLALKTLCLWFGGNTKGQDFAPGCWSQVQSLFPGPQLSFGDVAT